MANRMTKMLEKFALFPEPVRVKAQSLVLGNYVPMTGTLGLEFRVLQPGRVEIHVANRRKVRNHIGGVHACTTALAAETATGFAVGLVLPDDKLPLLKTMKVDYVKRGKGDMHAVATLDAESIARLQSEPKGSIDVPVTVTDGSGGEPVKCVFTWAWVPKK